MTVMTFFHIFLGFIYFFFWCMSFGLAKDRARRGKSYLVSVLTSVSLILFFVITIWVLINLTFPSVKLDYGFWTQMLAAKWVVFGLLGFVFSALLGAHFGILKYNHIDRFE